MDVEKPSISSFFDLCSLPSLKDLALRLPHGSKDLKSMIPHFIERSGCCLNTITFNSPKRRNEREGRAIQERFRKLGFPWWKLETTWLTQISMFKESKAR